MLIEEYQSLTCDTKYKPCKKETESESALSGVVNEIPQTVFYPRRIKISTELEKNRQWFVLLYIIKKTNTFIVF